MPYMADPTRSVNGASAREMARALGGEASGRRILCPGPGHSRQDRSLSILVDPQAPDGFLVNSFAGDDPLACRDHVREILGLEGWRGRRRDPSYRPPPRPPAADDGPTEEQRIALALARWREAVPIPGTIAERYLASRGLRLDGDLTHALRFHSRLWHREHQRHYGGLVALMRDALTGENRAIHRTFLQPDGRPVLEFFDECRKCASEPCRGHKLRKMYGPAAGAVIMLDEVTTGLHVGEGIETCLAARQLGYRPAWAMGSAGAIGELPVLPGIEALTVLGEHDAGANLRAARAVIERYEAAGIEAWLCWPPTGDLNDALQEAA